RGRRHGLHPTHPRRTIRDGQHVASGVYLPSNWLRTGALDLDDQSRAAAHGDDARWELPGREGAAIRDGPPTARPQGPSVQLTGMGEVEQLLHRKWSPEQISGRRRALKQPSMSKETIYRYVRRERRAGGQLWRELRILSKFGRKRRGSPATRGRLVGKRHISE